MLYKKHRPTTLQEMLLPPQIKSLIKRIATSENIPNSLILHSSIGGVGKTTLALILAKMINCHTKKDRCQCPSCQSLALNGTSKDVRMMDGTEFNTLDKIRQLKPYLSALPSHISKYRIVIIDEMHRLSGEAQSLFLEYLEFGNQSTIFIFTTTAIDKIIEPLVTRMSSIELPTPQWTDIWNYLIPIIQKENINISNEDLRHLVTKSKNSLRYALNELELFRLDPNYTYNHLMPQALKDFDLMIQFLQMGNSSSAYPIYANLVRDNNPTESMSSLLLYASREQGTLSLIQTKIAKAFLSTKPSTIDEAFLLLKLVIPKKETVNSKVKKVLEVMDKPSINEIKKPLPIYKDPSNPYYLEMLNDINKGVMSPAIEQEYSSFKQYMDSLPPKERRKQIPNNQLTEFFMDRYYREKKQTFNVTKGTAINLESILNKPITIYIKDNNQ